jgi:hypothetical protein
MPAHTPLLNLLKKMVGVDPNTDTFNIQTMLNDNWDKIDTAVSLKNGNADVRVATTANITLSGLQTIDGIVLATGDRVLVKNQTTGSQNGIYVAAAGVWSRATDADATIKLAAGLFVFVEEGSANSKTEWRMSNTGTVTLGTTALTFQQMGAVPTSAATANTIVMRDSNARAQFADPSAASDAATKGYVDSTEAGRPSKDAVRVATTANITLSGTQTIDGVAVVVGDRVLVKNQTTGSQNGIYVVAAAAWTRAIDFDSTTDISNGADIFVKEGSVSGQTIYRLSNTGAPTLGTTALTFALMSGKGSGTDAVIGNRTINDGIAIGTTDTDTPTNLFSKIGAMIRAITGKADWFAVPAISLDTVSERLNQEVNTTSSPTFAGATMNGSQTFTPVAVAANSWSRGAVFQYRDAANAIQSRSMGVNSNGELLFTWAGVHDYIMMRASNGDITYFVRPDGNDNNNGLANTAGGAFKTIQKAISMLPQVLNHTATINVAAGTYAEDVFVSGFVGNGILILQGDSVASSTRKINKLAAFRNTVTLQVIGFEATTTADNAFSFGSCLDVRFNYNKAVGVTGTYAGVYGYASRINVLQSELSNKISAIKAVAMSHIYSQNNTGNGNTYALDADSVSVIGTFVTQPAGSVRGTGSGVVNPWGEGNHFQRTHVIARKVSANQAIAGGVATAVTFENEFDDTLAEWDGTGLTASVTGYYQMAAVVTMNPSVRKYAEIKLMINGASDVVFGQGYSDPTYTTTLTGSTIVFLQAGQKIGVQFYSDGAQVVMAGAASTHVRFNRIP